MPVAPARLMPLFRLTERSRNSRSIVVAGLIVSLASVAAGQTSPRIEGTVIENGAAVRGANVRISGGTASAPHSTRTDSAGHFAVSVDSSTLVFTLEVTAIGYVAVSRQIRREVDQRFLPVTIDIRKAVVALPTTTVTAQRRRVARTDVANEGGVAGTASRFNNASAFSGAMTAEPAVLAATLSDVAVIPSASGDVSISVFGIASDQNATVLNDMSFGGTLPRDAYGLSVVSSTYDAGRGGFAGAQLSLRLRQGSNLSERSIRSTMDLRPVHPSTEVFPQSTSASRQTLASAMAAGPLMYNRAFYATTFQLTQRTNDAPSLFSLGDASLGRLGTSSAAVVSLKTILDSLGVPSGDFGAFNGSRTTDARLAVRLDLEPGLQRSRPGTTSVVPTTNDDYSLQFGGSAKARAGSLGGIAMLPSSNVKATDLDGWIQLTAAKYLASNVLNELTLSGALSASTAAPANHLPGAVVSLFAPSADASAPVSPTVQAGGANQSENDATTRSIGLRDRLSWSSWDRHHAPSITVDLSRETYRRTQDFSEGSFAYQSIAALAANAPDQFFRTLDARATRASAWRGAIGIGDVFVPAGPREMPLDAPAPIPTLEYGLRVEAAALGQRPHYTGALDSVFRRRGDAAIASFAVLPMLGFSWPILGAYTLANGFPFGRRGMLRGGIRKYRGTFAAQSEIPYLEATGVSGAVREVTCVGSAVPVPDWSGYAHGTVPVPEACVGDDVATPGLSQSAPIVRLLSADFKPMESWRPELSASLRLTDQVIVTGNATFAFNRDLAGSTDLNFDGVAKFALADEADRPVYVSPASIVSRTGLSTPLGSRRFAQFGRVYETRSDLRGETRSVGGSLAYSPSEFEPNTPRTTAVVSYTYSSARQQVSGFAGSTAGDPGAVTWVDGITAAHTVTVGMSRAWPHWARVQAQARIQSGLPFTPLVDGDVNGDGLRNDRAFVFDPHIATDTALASAMRQLLDTSPARECLMRQLSQVANANSCASAWSMPRLDVAITPAADRLPFGNRATVALLFSNVAAAVDQLMHGSSAHGWGQFSAADPNLLTIRGFDPTTQRYQYAVNSFFGSAAGTRALMRRPFLVTLDVRLDVGRDRETLLLESLLRGDGAPLTRSEIRARLGNGHRGLAALLGNARRLGLTETQTAQITELSKQVSAQRTVLIDSLVIVLDQAHGNYGTSAVRDAWHRTAVASYTNVVIGIQSALRVLTAEQRGEMGRGLGLLRDLEGIGKTNVLDVPALLRGAQGGIQ